MNFLSVLYAKAGITVDGVTTLNNTATGLTPATNDNSTKLATTGYVKNQNYYPYPTGTTAQYVRGDGSLATFTQTGGGGSSVSYYLNGSVSQGTIGGNAYYEMSKTAVVGTNADFTINANGYIAQFVTDAGDPALLNIPGGNWNFEMFFSASSGGGSPSFYVELYKYDGTTLTLIASGSAAPEAITGGTSTDLYITALAVPTTTLTLTDRLAVRVYVNHSGRTITLHTQNGHLCQVITTFTTGLTALNGLTAQVQNFAVGAGGTDFNISSVTDTHTFNLPTASATKRGALSSIDWSAFDAKVDFGDLSATSPLSYNGSGVFSIAQSSTSTNGYLSSTDWTTFNNKIGGSGTANYIAKFTSGSAVGNSAITDDGTTITLISRALSGTSATFSGNANADDYSLAAWKILDWTGSVAQIGGISAGQWNQLHFFTSGTSKLILDGSGNLGLGVTPSAWTDYKVLQLGGGSISSYTDNNFFEVNQNAFWNGSYKYVNNGFASRYEQNSGGHEWHIAPSGTAGNAITFTQAMTLLASGNLLIGTTTDAGYKLDVNGTARVVGQLNGEGGVRISGYTQRYTSYISDGLWGATATPNYISTTGYNGAYGSENFLLGYQDNGSGLYSPAYGFPVKSTDGTGTGDRVVRALIIKDIDKNSYPFTVYNNGNVEANAATFSSSVTAGGDIQSNGIYRDYQGEALLQTTTGAITQLGSNGAGTPRTLTFLAGNAERMRITDGGNVVIGTTSGSFPLTVVGKIGANIFSDSYLEFSSSGHVILKANNDVFVGYSQNFVVKQNGYVGVGTATPLYRLESTTTALFGTTAYGVLNIAGDNPAYIKIKTNIPFSYGNQGYTVNIKGFQYGSAQTLDLQICWHQYIDLFTSPTITSKGSFAPVVRLARENGLVVIVLTWGQYWPKLYVESVHNYLNDGYANGWTWVDENVTGDKTVTLSYKNDFGDGFVKTAAGLVGIGTNSPSAKLDVQGTNSNGLIQAYVTSGGGNALRLNSNFGGGNYIDLNPYISGVSNGGFEIKQNGTQRFVIADATGYIGIGTTSPTTKLTILDTSAITNHIDIVGYGVNAKGHIGQFYGNLYLSSNYFYNGTQNADDSSYGQAAVVISAGITNTSYIDFNLSDAGASNPSSKVRITSAGNVLIGTTTDAGYKLDVNGSVRFTNGTNPYLALYDGTSTSYLQVSGGNLDVRVGGANAITFNANSAERMRITSAGNVGINTTAPLAILSVGAGSLADINVPIQISSEGVGTQKWIGINKNGNYGLILGYTENGGLGGNGAYIRQVASDPMFFVVNSTTVAMTMLSTGNVGIGTTSPTTKFEVAGDIKASGLYYNGTSGGELRLDNSYGGGIGYYADQNGHNFYTWGSTGWANKMSITDSGNVGIGTTSPSAKLEILGNDDQIILNTAGTYSSIYFRNNGTSVGQLFSTNAATYLTTIGSRILYLGGGNGVTQITLDGTNVGIGTGSPNRTLSVNGIIGVASATANTQQLVFSIDSGASYITSSYFGSSSYVPMFFEAGGGVRMAIQTNGNIGIGTTTDAGYKLDVNGTLRGNNSLILINGAGDAYSTKISTAFDSGGQIIQSFIDSNAGTAWQGRLFFRTSSNGGALTTQLTIEHSGAATFSSSVTATSFTAGSGSEQSILQGGYLNFYNAAASNKWIKLTDDSSTINAIGFSKSGSVATTWFPSGNVGIGTASPNAKLTTYTSTGANLEVIHSNSGTFPKVSAIGLGSDAVGVTYTTSGGTLYTVGSAQIAAMQSASSNATTDLVFYTCSGGSVTEKMRIASTGAATFSSSVTATNFIVPGGTSAQFLKADGSLDSNVYLTATSSTFSYTASVTLSPTWQNTGVSSANLGTGAYLVTCNADDFGVGGGQYNCTYTGLMYFFAGTTNGVNANEIVLHHTGHADSNRYIYLRTLNTTNADGKTYLQISGNGTNSAASNYQLTFKKLL